MNKLTPLDIPLEEFIKPFFDADETVCLRIFSDKKNSAFRGQKLECQASKISGIIDTLKKHNRQDRGIFFVVNFGGHEDNEISRINAQFVENDTLSIEKQLEQIEAFPLPPSLIVRTKKSLHTYWLIKDGKVEDYRRVQKRLIAHFQGDPACVNESRVLRLPTFEHRKGEPFMVSLIKFNPELRYTQAELEMALPEVIDEVTWEKSNIPLGTRKGLILVGRRCDFIQHCKQNVATLSEHDWYSMITNIAVFEGSDRAIHALSKNYPKYSYKETQDKINHFMASNTKPITCKTIAEKGFKCPKSENGVCGCKSPAALCYNPLNIADLRLILSEQEQKSNALDNIEIARGFVTDYLYNVEPIIAETFISYEIKEFFKLKSNDIKPLLALHKEIYKRYAESKDNKRETSGEELPDWYEPTERGGLRFIPGILAKHMSENIHAFYGAESYYFYENGVYNE